MTKKYKIKKCFFCGNDITKRTNESIPTYYKRKFCKPSCQHEWNAKNKSKDIKCANCGKVFRRRQSGINKYNFCCLKCLYDWRHKQGSKKIECDWCGNKFSKVNSAILKHNFCSRKCMGEWQSKFCIGEMSYNWRGGVTALNHRIRSLEKNSDWIKSVFKRDSYTCQKCGDKTGGNLEVHHIKSVSEIIQEYKIKEIIDAIECEELWDTNNGITLCKKCHIKEHKK
jgi:hypothetical protein